MSEEEKKVVGWWYNRPRGKQRQRDHQQAKLLMNFRVTPNEKALIENGAKRRGLTRSSYLLYLVRKDSYRRKPEEEEETNEQ